MKTNNTNKNETKNSFSSISVNLSSAEIPEISPARVKRLRDDWVPWGSKNNYPDVLIDFSKKSTIHSAFIQLKKKLISAEGFSCSDNIEAFVEKPNEYGESLDIILKKAAQDLAITETCALMVRYGKGGKKVAALDYVDSTKVRVDKKLDEFGRVQGFWLCADWSNVRDNPPVYYETYNPSKQGKQSSQLWYFKNKGAGQDYYPDISYASALTNIETAYNLDEFLANTVANGFFSSAIVEINSEATEEQKRKFIQDFTQKNTGSKNAGKITFVWTSQPNSVKINPINPSDITAFVEKSRQITTDAIVVAHGGQGILAGVRQEGNGLGSDGNLFNTAMKTYYSTVIRDYQKPVIDFLKSVFDYNGVTEYELEVKSSALILDENRMIDLLKPEAYITDYGYDVEDLLNPSDEVEEEVNPAEKKDGTTDTDETSPEDTGIL
ncbi:phage portal protein [Rufibacter immobilis]|uniref:Phage portal protein n=1 Tax=Rufibacter immobilis TaxID=1348778 RepID=A0A3M9MZM1_9BACT|nr:phage portal protein [Rufibacter immobilis]RNI30950.1 phage portal protein [Rufibacter immobilis]